MAPNSSGYRVYITPMSRPPFEPPWAPSCSRVVMPRATRSRATAAKSSYARSRFSFNAAVCQSGPYSPPPRMFASTYTPPRSIHDVPDTAV